MFSVMPFPSDDLLVVFIKTRTTSQLMSFILPIQALYIINSMRYIAAKYPCMHHTLLALSDVIPMISESYDE